MTPKKLIHSYPFVELPDPKIRYLISDEKRDPLAVIWFEDNGTPHLRYTAVRLKFMMLAS